MTTPLAPALPLSVPILGPDKKKRVLLVDPWQAKHELCAEVTGPLHHGILEDVNRNRPRHRPV